MGGGAVNQNGTSSATGAGINFKFDLFPTRGTKLELQDLFLGGKSDVY
eukprot:CAMPEP_0168610846 /NCGR_PEP_ID=MMETSP0449_2-20121227/2019_1 /TAXON_ID=1082188 /ORGANISM="Strombidium rassoulzadegani, Strain ras09" /LENGTH=47 /DNA_ID= /DNA_START= /DNA_END= /DNA_ORIENTATION=